MGASFAYALLLSGLTSKILLIDVNHAKAEGEAMDLNHAGRSPAAMRHFAHAGTGQTALTPSGHS